jgi:ABC-type uncharacterized transport system substrate-binding protein
MSCRLLVFICLVPTIVLSAFSLIEAQQAHKVARVGVLLSGSPSSQPGRMEAFRRGLQDLGYQEGKNIVIEERSTERDKLDMHAAELVRRNVHVVLTAGTSSTRAARNATKTIPIVMTFVSDPEGFGFIKSLARPGGNVTGLTNLAPELAGKWLELLKEVSPNAVEVAVLLDSTTRIQPLLFNNMRVPAIALGMKLISLELRAFKEDVESASATLKKRRSDSLIALVPPITPLRIQQILDFAAKNRLPAMYHWREYVDAGGLAFYGANLSDMYRVPRCSWTRF